LPTRLDRASMAHARPYPPPQPRRPQETWLVYYGDVRVGAVALRSGNPADTDQWGWRCGSIRDLIHENIRAAPRLRSIKRAPISRMLGAYSSRTAPRPIFRHGAVSAIGPRKNTGASIAASTCRMIGNRVPDRAAGSEHSRIRSSCRTAASSSRSRMPGPTSPGCRKPSTRRRNGKRRWKR
jgi:hypothetical protein